LIQIQRCEHLKRDTVSDLPRDALELAPPSEQNGIPLLDVRQAAYLDPATGTPSDFERYAMVREQRIALRASRPAFEVLELSLATVPERCI